MVEVKVKVRTPAGVVLASPLQNAGMLDSSTQFASCRRWFPAMMWGGNGSGGPSGGWVMFAVIVIAVIAVIVAIDFLVRYLSRIGDTSSTAAVPPSSPRSATRFEAILAKGGRSR